MTAKTSPAAQGTVAGWKLVPVEPTQAMMAAPKMREWACRTEDDVTAEDVADCYRQMLAAAPKPSSADSDSDRPSFR